MKVLINKYIVRQGLYWAIFILTSVTITMKIVEVSAFESYKVILRTPDIGQYSRMVNYWYYPF